MDANAQGKIYVRSADLKALSSAGISMYSGSTKVTNEYPITGLPIELRIVDNKPEMFFDNSVAIEVNYAGTLDYARISSDGTSAFWDSFPSFENRAANGLVFKYGRKLPATPLTWVTKPTSGEVGSALTFIWMGGITSSQNVYIKQNGNVIISSGSSNHQYITDTSLTVGNYVIEISDGSTTLTANFNITAAVLSWVVAPSDVVQGTSKNISWSGGEPDSQGYQLLLLSGDGSIELDNVRLTNPAYVIPNDKAVGAYKIEVYDKGGKSDSTANKIEGSFNVTAKPADYVISQSDIDALNNNHTRLEINGSAAAVGAKLFVGDVLTAYAGNGWEFIKNSGSPTSSIYFRANVLGQVKYGEFTISADNKTATYNFKRPSNDPQYKWGELHVSTTQSSAVYGSNNVYIINDDILGLVNGKRFTTVTGASGETSVYDYGQFILSVLQLPFNIDPDIILQPENIMLATLNTKVPAPKLSTDKIELDLGSISIPNSNNNLLDYVGATAIIHLPRSDSMAVDLDYVVGQTISIKYIVDCYTGVATINIYSTKINDVIITRQVNLGVDIPYANTMTGRSVDNSGINVGGDNGIKTPFIEIVKSDFIKPDGFFTIPIIDENVLSSQKGFVRIDEVNLNSKAIKSEKDELISILNNGVIIK